VVVLRAAELAPAGDVVRAVADAVTSLLHDGEKVSPAFAGAMAARATPEEVHASVA
jgi:hypothetical protein